MSKTSPNVILIEGKLYDTLKLAKLHPGGEIFVLQANNTDGTALFNSSHRRTFPHDQYTACLVSGSAAPAKLPSTMESDTQDYSNYFELCRLIQPHLTNRGYAPTYYFVKVALVLGLAFYCDFYCTFISRTYWMSILCGFLFGLIGLNVQHDANHGAVHPSGWVNRLLGLSQDYIGGVASGWMVSHNVVHHVYCNDPHRDHDLDLAIIRLKSNTKWFSFHQLQQYYFLALELLFSPSHISFNIGLTLEKIREQGVMVEYWKTHRNLFALQFIRIVVGLAISPSWTTVAQLAVQYMVGGFYLSFFFLLSHNFEGVAKDGIDGSKGDFVRNQAITSCNVGGWFLAQCNGGLNYQIEHHLFPRIHHSFYPTIAPVVKAFCKSKGIAYVHYPTITENFLSLFKHLRTLGAHA